ncbi:hypothetical protein HJG60_004167 [Phyllostomus discolor]|uniref:Uncharacterized protein n=1 Tax=Phyllostomus discolor TaxID=89673 RepID=A0A834E5B3_9CHIR|nr:hypothetical protein HJG60_004167 [Phyllostomus discolor]
MKYSRNAFWLHISLCYQRVDNSDDASLKAAIQKHGHLEELSPKDDNRMD